MGSFFLRTVTMKKPIGLLIVSLLFMTSEAEVYSYECHKVTGPSSMPNTQDYAPPYNVFSSQQEVFLKANCGVGRSVELIIEDTAVSNFQIYETGYFQPIGGDTWLRLAFEGADKAGEYFSNSATKTIGPTEEVLQNGFYYIAYTCFLDGAQWLCGCKDINCSEPFWQLQFVQSKGVWPLPLSYNRVTSRHCVSNSYGLHLGIDVLNKEGQVPPGTNVFSVCSGDVIENTTHRDVWNSFLIIKHNCGGDIIYGYYGHLASDLAKNTKVQRGEIIGSLKDWPGNTHLHFSVSVADDWIRNGWGYEPNSSCEDATRNGWRDPLDLFFWER